MSLAPRILKVTLYAALVLGLLCGAAATAAAQWISLPLAGTPRTPDGKPNLNAPTPRGTNGKPDLSGIWRPDSGRYNETLMPDGTEAPMLPWAAAEYKRRQDTHGFDKPQVRCMPHGVPDAMLVPNLPFKIVQTPSVTIVLYEMFNQFRQIFTDGRRFPVDPNPAWYGYSVGVWVGDTFLVESEGFKEGSWLDNGGHPHTDALRVVERFHRPSFGHMELDVTVSDTKAYTRPWTSTTIRLVLLPDTELIEHLCENEKDAALVTDK